MIVFNNYICDEKIIYFRQEPGKKEEIITVEDPLYENTLPDGGEGWVWMISPKGEIEKYIGIWHQVRAINLS